VRLGTGLSLGGAAAFDETAATVRGAEVCRYSCSVMRLRPADFHASSVRSDGFPPVKDRMAVAPKPIPSRALAVVQALGEVGPQQGDD
jgi:hypothetical protein